MLQRPVSSYLLPTADSGASAVPILVWVAPGEAVLTQLQFRIRHSVYFVQGPAARGRHWRFLQCVCAAVEPNGGFSSRVFEGFSPKFALPLMGFMSGVSKVLCGP